MAPVEPRLVIRPGDGIMPRAAVFGVKCRWPCLRDALMLPGEGRDPAPPSVPLAPAFAGERRALQPWSITL